MGRGGISAEDLPPAGRAVGMARPPVRMEAVVPAAAGRRSAGRRGTGAGHGAAVAVCGAARRAGRGRRGAGPALARRGLGDAAPALLVTPTRPGRRPAPHARGRAGAVPRSNRCAPRWARAALDAVYLNSECNASIRQHRRLWGGTRNVLWLGCRCWSCCRPTPAAPSWRMNARTSPAGTDAMPAGCISRGSNGRKRRGNWRVARAANAPLRLFMNWHVPRFLAASLDFARECEYQADAESARVCGVACASDALMATCLQGVPCTNTHPACTPTPRPRNHPGSWSGWRRMARWPVHVTRPRRRSGCIRPCAVRPAMTIPIPRWRTAWRR